MFGVLDETHLRQQKTTIIEHYIYSSSDARRCFCISSRACALQDPNWGQLSLDLPDSGPIQVVGCRHTPNWSVNRVILFQFWPLPTPRSWTPRAHGAGRAWQLFYCILRGTICVSMERAASKVPVVRTKERRKEGRKEGSTSGSKEEERTKESYEF